MLLRTLGGLALADTEFGRHKPLSLLAYLALEGAKGRSFLAELLWPNAKRPRQNLDMALYHLRQAAPDALGADDMRLWTTVECDAGLLRKAAVERRWSDVVTLYSGPFFDGVDLARVPTEFEEWLLETREMLAAIAQRGLVEVAERARVRGDMGVAAGLADRAAALMPATNLEDPSLLARLHALLTASGNPRAAAVRREAAEFGLVLGSTPGIPPTPSEGQGRVSMATLPNVATPFLGRTRELRELEDLLDADARIVTVHGLSGMGKTRLALAFAQQEAARGTYDEVLFLALEPGTAPGMLLERAAVALAGGVAAQSVDAIRERLGMKRVLLVLDDFPYHPATAALVADLSAACPQLALVITSLQPLDVPGELLFALDGLSLPPTAADAREQVARFGSTYLFTRTAQRYDPHFELDEGNAEDVLAICRSVAGAPLGIEIAAALTRVVPPAELARELATSLDTLVATSGTLPSRHSSMRAVFDRSWSELDEAGRAALAGASVFRGGFTRAAAVAVLDMRLPLLTTLLDRSLVRRSGNRYDLHPLVRHYAAEQLLRSADSAQVHERHTEHYCALLESKRPVDQRAGQRVAFDELDRESANTRAAWEWAVGAARHDLLERMVPMLTRHLLARRRLTELRGLLGGAIAGAPAGSLLEARVLRAQAEAVTTVDPSQARTLLERALAVFRSHGTDDDVAPTLLALATANLHAGDYANGRELSLAARTLLEHHDGEGLLGACLAQLAFTTADAPEWESQTARAIACHRRSGNISELSPMLYADACHLVITQGDHGASLRRLEEAIALERDQVDRGYLLAHLHTAAGFCQVQLGDLAAAKRHLSESDRLFSQGEAWEGRQQWEGTGSHGAQREDWAQAYLHHAEGRLEVARRAAERAVDYPVALDLLIRLELDAGAVAEAEAHTAGLRAAVFSPLGVRQSLYLQAMACLYRAEIALARQSRDPAAPLRASRPGAAQAVAELLCALPLIHDRGFVPLAFEAIVVAHRVVPGGVPTGWLEFAATHLSARLHTRQRAARLLGAGAARSTAGVVSDAAAPPLARRADPSAEPMGPQPSPVLTLMTVLKSALLPVNTRAKDSGAVLG